MMRILAEKQIQRVLLTVWDPIGVKDIPEAQDEYDSYAPHVYSLLKSGRSDQQIAQELLYIATETMGLSGPTLEDMRPTVEALRQIPL
jgi:hypothetical protein